MDTGKHRCKILIFAKRGMISQNFVKKYLTHTNDSFLLSPGLFLNHLTYSPFFTNVRPPFLHLQPPFFLLQCICILFLHLFYVYNASFSPCPSWPCGSGLGSINYSIFLSDGFFMDPTQAAGSRHGCLTLYQNPDGGYQHKINGKQR